MLTVDIALPDVEELHKLVAEGREKGFLSYDEIATACEDVVLTKEQVEDFYTYLIEHGVDVVEGERHKAPPHEPPPPEDEAAQLPPLLPCPAVPAPPLPVLFCPAPPPEPPAFPPMSCADAMATPASNAAVLSNSCFLME